MKDRQEVRAVGYCETGGGKLKNASKWGFTAERGRNKECLDEGKPFIRGGGRSDITPKLVDILICIITCYARSLRAEVNAVET